MAYFDGAPHEGGSLYGLSKHPQQVRRGLLELEALGHAPREVLKALHRVAPRQGFIGSVQPVGTERAPSGLWDAVVSLDLRGCGEGREGCPAVPLPLPLIPVAPLPPVTANCQGKLGGQANRQAGALTWRTPSPAGHSRTRCTRLSARTPACHSLWAAGHPPPRPPTAQTAKSAGGKVGLSGAWGICMPQAPFRAHTHIHARMRAHARAHFPPRPSPRLA